MCGLGIALMITAVTPVIAETMVGTIVARPGISEAAAKRIGFEFGGCLTRAGARGYVASPTGEYSGSVEVYGDRLDRRAVARCFEAVNR